MTNPPATELSRTRNTLKRTRLGCYKTKSFWINKENQTCCYLPICACMCLKYFVCLISGHTPMEPSLALMNRCLGLCQAIRHGCSNSPPKQHFSSDKSGFLMLISVVSALNNTYPPLCNQMPVCNKSRWGVGQKEHQVADCTILARVQPPCLYVLLT